MSLKIHESIILPSIFYLPYLWENFGFLSEFHNRSHQFEVL